MRDHIQECPVYEGSCCPWMGDCDCQCLCDILSACENRVLEEAYNAILVLDPHGFDISMDAALHAIDSLKVRNYLANNLSTAYNEDGYKIDPNCKHEDTWFSRTLCYCIPEGDMHTICSDCGLTWLGEDKWGICDER